VAGSKAFDEVFSRAVPLAAKRLTSIGSSSFREVHIEEAMIDVIEEEFAGFGAERSGAGRVQVPGWDRPLGGFDLRITRSGSTSVALVEVKIDNVDQTLWDFFKLAAALTEQDVESAYLLVARLAGSWAHGDCTRLFDPDSSTRWRAAAMFEAWAGAWRSLLRGGSARPLSVPAEVATEFIAAKEIRRPFESYELRAVAVRLVEGAARLHFDGDWPESGGPAQC
jgi:hypothetical protein